MNETQRNIKRYKAALPGLRERITAAALLLAISLSMVVSASFAWYTISSAPEVSAINTTIAGNGNLEIALAHGAMKDEQKEPDEVAIGQSSAAGKDLLESNITWGNLVNLSDPRYGLTEIDLRPALLSTVMLNTTPLYGATYSDDGRVKDVSATYRYASWMFAADGNGYFAAGKKAAQYGVRAISSVKMENVAGNAAINNMFTAADQAQKSARLMYSNLISTGDNATLVSESPRVTCMDALTKLLEVYVQESGESALTSGGDVYLDYGGVVTYTYNLLEKYYDVLMQEAESLRLMANLQIFAKSGEENKIKTVDDLLTILKKTDGLKELTDMGVELQSLVGYEQVNSKGKTEIVGSFQSTVEKIEYAMNGLRQYAIDYDLKNPNRKTEKLYWLDKVPALDANGNEIRDQITRQVDGIGKYVQTLVDIPSTMVGDVPISGINAGNATSFLNESKVHKILIQKGALKDTEQRLGNLLAADHADGVYVVLNVDLNAIITRIKKVQGRVRTSAKAPFLGTLDLEDCGGRQASGEGEAVSLDTYGMAVDFWARTNAHNTHLILEGQTLYETIPETCINKDNKETEVYLATKEDLVKKIYRIPDRDDSSLADNDAGVTWYDADTHAQIITGDQIASSGYTLKDSMLDVIVGYEGENRVWKDWREMLEAGLIDEHNTTQGAGSCYVFYADPSEQTRIMGLLEAFTVAFIDQSGTKLAAAKLDTESAYSINGKVTVPLELIEGSRYISKDGEETLGICLMEQNEATWITAIMYMDGLKMTNEHVLSAGEIEGHLNLQFGTSDDIITAGNKELQEKTRIISAQAFYNGQLISGEPNYDPYEFDSYVAGGRDIEVVLTVEGDQPNNISGFFVRSIGTSQGSVTNEMKFTPRNDGSGTWTATFNLTNPGEYYLREVLVDGASYSLERTELDENGEKRVVKMHPGIKIPGLRITNVECEPGSGKILTADNNYPVEVSAWIETAAGLNPRRVEAVFRGKDGKGNDNGEEYRALMSYDTTAKKWSGTARLDTTGVYVLEYLELDKELMMLEPSQQTRLDLTLGLSVMGSWVGTVNNNSQEPVDSVDFRFTKSDDEYTVTMEIDILDSNEKSIPELQNVKMYYWKKGTTGNDANRDALGMQYTKMEWDPVKQVYRGSAKLTSAGEYVFNRVEITDGENTSMIKKTLWMPSFSARPALPPSFDTNSTSQGYEFQFAPNGDATVTVDMFYAQTAEVWIEVDNLSDGKNTTYLVKQKEAGKPIDLIPDGLSGEELEKYQNHQEFTFVLPSKDNSVTYKGFTYNGTQDGIWEVKRVLVCNTYDANDNLILGTEDGATAPPANSLKFNVESGKIVTEVADTVSMVNTPNTTPTLSNMVDNVTIKVNNSTAADKVSVDGNIVLGATLDGTTRVPSGNFLDAYEVTFNVAFVDWKGDLIEAEYIGNVSLNMSYDRTNMYAMGSYTSDDAIYQQLSGEAAYMTANADGTYSAKRTVQLAGTYTTEVSFPGFDTRNDAKNAIADLEVWSKKSIVKVTKVSPEGTYDVNTSTGDNLTVLGGVSNTITDDGYTANVYIRYTGSSSFIVTWYNYEAPSVTLTLSNVSVNFSQATMTFGHRSSADYAKTYTFTPGNGLAQSNNIGYVGSAPTLGGHAPRDHAGRQTVTQITITDTNGATYTVDLDRAVTIDQPQYPRYMDFNSTASGLTLPITPARIFGTPNVEGTFTIVLPDSQTWTTVDVWQDENVTFEQARQRTHKGYVEYKDGCNTRYDLWSMVETEYVGEGMKYSRTDTHTITDWMVNGKKYKPGTEVKISANTTVTAVISTMTGTVVTEPGARNVYYDWDYTEDKTSQSNHNGYNTKWDGDNTTVFADVKDNHSNVTPYGGTWN